MKIPKLQLLTTLFLATLLFAGCKDECKDVTCVKGACVDGNCVCDAGYSGTDCSVAHNAKFNGRYTSDENCTVGGTQTYDVEIAPKAGSATQVVFSDMWATPGHDVVAVVAENGTTFSIAKQDLGQSGYDLETTSGTITADGKTITMAFNVYIDDTTFLQSCTATLTR